MANSTIQGDVFFRGGAVRFSSSVALPDSTILNAAVSASAAITQDKLEHLFRHNFYQEGSAVAVTALPIYKARGTGTVIAVAASLNVIPSVDRTVVIDILKNGTTILGSTFTMDSGNTIYLREAGSVSVTAIADDDYFELTTTLGGSTGTNPAGLAIEFVIKEDP